MHPSLPAMHPEAQRLLTVYVSALVAADIPLVGVYLYGSLAQGAFHPDTSDIDLIVLTSRGLERDDARQLRHLHDQLADIHPWTSRLSIAYVPYPLPDSSLIEVAYPVMRDGTFRTSGGGDVNAVSWWQIHHQGIVCHGPAPSTLKLPCSWTAVEAAMHDNLRGYWADKANQPALFLDDFWVQFAVTTLCRILTTLEDGEIVAKDEAVARWASRLPSAWHPLLVETQRLRLHPEMASRYRTPDERQRDTLAFYAYASQRAQRRSRSTTAPLSLC